MEGSVERIGYWYMFLQNWQRHFLWKNKPKFSPKIAAANANGVESRTPNPTGVGATNLLLEYGVEDSADE